MSDRRKRGGLALLAIAAAVSAVAALLYVPTLRYDYTYLDDTTLILDQRAPLAGPSCVTRALTRTYTGVPSDTYYRPLVNLSLALDARLTGLRPAGYHLTNTVLHVLAGMLVLGLLWQIGCRILPVLFGALLFVAHPIQVASVAWIPGRNDLLMACFALGGSLTLLRNAGHPHLALRLGHLACFLGALLSKETAFCLPAVWLLLLWAARAARGELRRPWIWTGWLSVMAIATAARIAVVDLPEGYVADRARIAVERLPVVVADLGKLVCPVRLQVLSAPGDIALWPGIPAALVLGAACLAVPRARRRIMVLALALLLVPMLASLPGARHVVLENRLYLPVAGLALLTSEVLRAAGSSSPRVRAVSAAVAAVVLSILGAASGLHRDHYRNRERFSEAAMAASPHSSIAANLRFRRAYSRDLANSTRVPQRPGSY